MQVEITDVFLRDGLQDEPVVVDTDAKVAIANELAAAGVPRIEVGSFVHPRKVPQMADTPEVFERLSFGATPVTTALTLNGRGVERALAAGVQEIGIVVSASEAHGKANAGLGVEDALAGLGAVTRLHPEATFAAGVSTAFTCPFEGAIPHERLVRVVQGFVDLGVTSIGLADTLGTTTTDDVIAALQAVRVAVPEADLGLHLHNAHGQALETVSAALQIGVTRFDAALSGFGGCPFAPGAAGNLAAEELVRHVHALGYDTGIDSTLLSAVAETARAAVASATPIAATAAN